MSLRPSQILRKFFFNSKCSLCKKEVEEDEIYLCRKCREKIEKQKNLHVRKNIYYLFEYKNDIRNLIIDYKLNGRKEIGVFISRIIEEDLKKIIRENKIDIVVPVPASREKVLERGFNQVEFILDEIGIEYKKAVREKDTLPMHRLLEKNLRKINIKSVFRCRFLTENKNILIVDDIITTGTTVEEMIKALENSGKPKNIFVFSISAASSFYKKYL